MHHHHSTTDLGDYIGMESCVDLETDTTLPSATGGDGDGGGPPVNRKPWRMPLSRRSSSSLSGEKKVNKLPPPMPIQSSTVMKRYYTDDGRLIITEEKVETPKYSFTAIRSHGRLTLQLVNSDSDLDSVSDSVSHSDFKSVENDCNSLENEKENGISVCSSKVETVMDGNGNGDGNVDGGKRGGMKCFIATGSSCLFVKQNRQLHAIRPLQI